MGKTLVPTNSRLINLFSTVCLSILKAKYILLFQFGSRQLSANRLFHARIDLVPGIWIGGAAALAPSARNRGW